jgi:hypothetical protein
MIFNCHVWFPAGKFPHGLMGNLGSFTASPTSVRVETHCQLAPEMTNFGYSQVSMNCPTWDWYVQLNKINMFQCFPLKMNISQHIPTIFAPKKDGIYNYLHHPHLIHGHANIPWAPVTSIRGIRGPTTWSGPDPFAISVSYHAKRLLLLG